MRRLLAALAAAVAFLPVVNAHACSCAQSTPQQQAQRADAVFTGTVGGITSVSQLRTSYSFSVETVYKGSVGSMVTIYSDTVGGACGANFIARSRYTVFATANPQEGGLATSSCAGNTPNTIDPAVYSLPPGRAPASSGGGIVVVNQGGPTSPAPDFSWLWVPLAVLGIGTVTLAMVWLLLRRRLS